MFAEILKTQDSGQFSFFTAKPGVTRGGHYHHSKTEKFLVIQGEARFGFRHLALDQTHQITTTSKDLLIIETVPGWSHNITNIGTEDIIVMLWANEIFDTDNPDTVKHNV
jgi:UDP-2-acetamido-2,6-beta-L-arabino-hexul-4-ose reductase